MIVRNTPSSAKNSVGARASSKAILSGQQESVVLSLGMTGVSSGSHDLTNKDYGVGGGREVERTLTHGE